jgi:hypothetical protein
MPVRVAVAFFIARFVFVLVWTVTALLSRQPVGDRVIDICLAAFFGISFLLTLGLAERIGWGTLTTLLFEIFVFAVVVDSADKDAFTFLIGLVLLVAAAVLTKLEGRRLVSSESS